MKTTERQFIESLRRKAGGPGTALKGVGLSLRLGIGDDCAVLSGSGRHDLLVTTDLMLEGVHFRREWQTARSLGHKVLARGLSDIAAMGGIPRYSFLSLGLPRGAESGWVDQFLAGFLRLAEACGVRLAGGDTARSKSGIVADIVVIGEARRGKAILRSGARPGDAIWVTGRLGGAAVALDLLRKRKKLTGRKDVLRPLFYPQPRLAIGQWLSRQGLASAMIDLSDGLSIDLARLSKSSGVGARIEAEAVPRLPRTPLPKALHGGEDFELLFTVPASRAGRIPHQLDGIPLTRIGRVLRGRRLRLARGESEEELPVLGFEHF